MKIWKWRGVELTNLIHSLWKILEWLWSGNGIILAHRMELTKLIRSLWKILEWLWSGNGIILAQMPRIILE